MPGKSPARKGLTGPLRKTATMADVKEEKVGRQGTIARMGSMQAGGKMSFGRGPQKLEQTFIHLVQKPTRQNDVKLKASIRDLKNRGYALYERSRRETNEIFNYVKTVKGILQEDINKAIEIQNEAIVIRVETRLTQLQAEFLKKTEKAADTIFKEANRMVLEALDKAEKRTDAVVDAHDLQT